MKNQTSCKNAKSIPYGLFLSLFALFIDKLKIIVPITQVMNPIIDDSANNVHIVLI